MTAGDPTDKHLLKVTIFVTPLIPNQGHTWVQQFHICFKLQTLSLSHRMIQWKYQTLAVGAVHSSLFRSGQGFAADLVSYRPSQAA